MLVLPFPDNNVLTDVLSKGLLKSKEIYPNETKPDQKIREIRGWLKARGVLDFEPVTLFAEQLEKVCRPIKSELSNAC